MGERQEVEKRHFQRDLRTRYDDDTGAADDDNGFPAPRNYAPSPGRAGGAITAALFLSEFVDIKKTAWAHIDIAGPVWNDQKGGATGFGVGLLVDYVTKAGKAVEKSK